MSRQSTSPPPIDPAAGVPGIRTLGTGPNQATPGNDGRFTSNLANTMGTVPAMRACTVTPASDSVWTTNGRHVVGDGGGWYYRWDNSSTATDDGVLVIQATAITTGRFLAIRPDNGIISGACVGPAASDLGTRTKSFDPTGVVAIGSELFRVTKILRDAGYAGLDLPNLGVGYKIGGGEQIAPSAVAHQPFWFGSKSGARLVGPSGAHVQNTGIGAVAWGLGDTTIGTLLNLDAAGNPSFTQTLTGGERQLVGVSNVIGLAAGDTIVVYMGADITDASGWCAGWLMTEIESIAVTSSPVGNINIKSSIPSPMPATSGSRGAQTHHTIRKITGFQDALTISGFSLYNVGLGQQFSRNAVIDCHFEQSVIAHNHFACSGMRISRFTADRITGYDQLGLGPGHGALSWYGAAVILQQCYTTLFDFVKIEDLDGVPLFTEELGSRGTRITLCDVNWNATNSWNGSCALFGASGGSTEIISVGHLITRGGYGGSTTIAATSIGTWEDRGSSLNETVGARADAADRLLWRGQGYRTKRRFQMAIPVPLSGVQTHIIPCNGLIRDMNMQVGCPNTFSSLATIGINQLDVDGTTAGTNYDVRGYLVARDTWFPINPACILSVGCPNFYGYCTPRIIIGGDGINTVAGTVLYVDIEMFLPEMNTAGQPVVTDLSLPMLIGGSGAPTANAKFVSQEYIDTTATPRKWYKSINVGTGASDWQVLGSAALDAELAAIAGLTSAADRLPYFTGVGTAALATFTATGRTVAAAADAAALTALINLATTSLAGLLSAAQKTQLDKAERLIVSGTRTAQAIGSFSVATWTALTYKSVRLVIRQTGHATTGGIDHINLTSLTGAYKSSVHFDDSGSANVVHFNSAAWYVGWGGQIASTPLGFVFDLPVAPALKTFSGISQISSTTNTQLQVHGGSNADTTHEVTGIEIVTINDTTDFSYELYGTPS